MRILLGLLKAQGGSVTVNGVAIGDTDLESLYACITLVSQDSPVFDGTVRENLVPGVGTEEEQLHHAIRVAHLDTVLSRLELGLDTPVGERGLRMSAGERQRIGLARALAGLLRELQGRSVLLVAHRLQPVRASDTVCVMEDGAVVEAGPFATLVAAGGRFQRLWMEQTRA